eukprot:gene8195-7837_t
MNDPRNADPGYAQEHRIAVLANSTGMAHAERDTWFLHEFMADAGFASAGVVYATAGGAAGDAGARWAALIARHGHRMLFEQGPIHFMYDDVTCACPTPRRVQHPTHLQLAPHWQLVGMSFDIAGPLLETKAHALVADRMRADTRRGRLLFDGAPAVFLHTHFLGRKS